MIRVLIDMEPTTGALNVRSEAPPPIVFAVVTAAYHELLSTKIRDDLKAERRIVEPPPRSIVS